MRKVLSIIAIVLCLGGIGWVLANYWSQIFAKNIVGRLDGLERVEPHSALLSARSSTSKSSDKLFFSFAIAIRTQDGEIVTSSSEDRQWAVARVGQCVQARLFPYPPWDLEKAGTYFGARLKHLSDCNLADWPQASPVPPGSPDIGSGPGGSQKDSGSLENRTLEPGDTTSEESTTLE